ncbi:hypothetical protein [Streptomyces sp. NPDC097981]|uniref:hypothetical protein n=1 Tax=Streptomyces sp. NPDC097981 TaxID=3155428 RepID=UPI00331C17F1
MNIQPLLDAFGIQEDAVRALTDGLRAQITELQARLQEAEMHLKVRRIPHVRYPAGR